MFKLTIGILLLTSQAFGLAFTRVAIVTAGDMSTASIASKGTDLGQYINASVQCVFTGAPVGTLKLQFSDDIVAISVGGNPSANVVNWTDYTGSSQAIIAAGDFTYNLLDAGYQWLRLVYTRTSGTGTLNCNLDGKGR